MKDNFSKQASVYAKFRPQYPDEMIAHVVSFVDNKSAALDIATGNGQVAAKLADSFEAVYATDISQTQLDNAIQKPNLVYKKESAEKTSFEDRHFDLITVAQAIHWFDFDVFYKEIKRILKPEGVFAVLGYGLFSTNPDTDVLLHNFYHNIVGPYWDAERKYIDDNYKTIPFPFKEIETKQFENRFTWTLEQLTGYLDTWSATQHYIKANKSNPIDLIREDLERSWEKGDKQVVFPQLLRIGKL